MIKKPARVSSSCFKKIIFNYREIFKVSNLFKNVNGYRTIGYLQLRPNYKFSKKRITLVSHQIYDSANSK